MTETLLKIFELEDKEEFENAYAAYLDLYSKEGKDYDTWKHFYFFLWIATEDATEKFIKENNINHQLINVLNDGIPLFNHLADFYFIAGYTISISPWQFGDATEWEQKSEVMLRTATEFEPNNSIYKLAYLSEVININDPEYSLAEINAAQDVLEIFSGTGILNNYFRLVLYRGNKAYR